jgi:hypothetical protein
MELTFLEQLAALLQQEDLVALNREASDLRARFEDYVLQQEHAMQVEELEAQERGESVDQAARKEALEQEKESFKSGYQEFREKRRAQKEGLEAEEQRNLGLKMALIKRLGELVRTEENIGAAFATLKEIQESWKEIGDIPRKKRNEVETEYSHLLDEFFYNIKIYKELKEHDFHRNHQLKLDLITQLKKLNELTSIKEIDAKLKQLQDEWNDIGPVPNEEWDNLKEAYWTEVRSVYNKVNRFYEDRRAELQANMEQKKALIEELRALLQQEEEMDSAKAWEKRTAEVIAIQNRWKEIGFGPRRENDALFKQLRSMCDAFFKEKKNYFEGLQGAYNEIAEKKKQLIEQAREVQTGEQSAEAANKLKNLQRKWKELGHSGVRNEQRLWKEFRAVCDAYFNARQEQFAEQEREQEENLKRKQEVLARLQSYTLAEEKSQALQELKALSAEFNAIGHVPLKAKQGLFNDFKAAMDGKYAALKMDENEKEQILFQAKVETLQASPDAFRQLRGLKDEIRKEIDRHTKEITQLENNLGFFANSKGAQALAKEVEKKVERSRSKIAQLKAQLKLIPNE